jgi:hypothetical protein
MPRSSTFGVEPPPQQETLSRAARASGVPTCSEVIHTLAIPAQVMLPDPPALPSVYPQEPSALAQATQYCWARTQVSSFTRTPARAASCRPSRANCELELSPPPPRSRCP